jgi:hypothetical protein
MQRNLVLGASIALVALLAFLTLADVLEGGFSPVGVIFAIVILAVLGLGVLGAIGSADDE